MVTPIKQFCISSCPLQADCNRFTAGGSGFSTSSPGLLHHSERLALTGFNSPQEWGPLFSALSPIPSWQLVSRDSVQLEHYLTEPHCLHLHSLQWLTWIESHFMTYEKLVLCNNNLINVIFLINFLLVPMGILAPALIPNLTSRYNHCPRFGLETQSFW